MVNCIITWCNVIYLADFNQLQLNKTKDNLPYQNLLLINVHIFLFNIKQFFQERHKGIRNNQIY